MCQACFYLTNTDFPIYEIAQKVGYDNLGFSTGSSLSFII